MPADKISAKKERYRFQALRDLTRTIPREKELVRSLRYSLRSMMGALSVSRGAMVIYEKGSVTYLLARGLEILESDLELNEPLQKYFRHREGSLSIYNRRISRKIREFFSSHPFADGEVETVCPIKNGRELLGLVILGKKIDNSPARRQELEFLNVMAHYIGAEISSRKVVSMIESLNTNLSEKIEENMKLITSLRSVYFQTIMALAAAIDAKDPHTRGHSERVARISREIAQKLELPEEEVNSVYMAGILHDVGKIATAREILTKDGELSREEKEKVKDHPKVSFRILSKVSFPDSNIPDLALLHHEWYNGKGYPYGKREDEIPLGARIISLADAFDAMVADRPYRKGKTVSEALSEICDFSGKQFDPYVVCAFLEVLIDEVERGGKKRVLKPAGKNGRISKKTLGSIKRYLDMNRRTLRQSVLQDSVPS